MIELQWLQLLEVEGSYLFHYEGDDPEIPLPVLDEARAVVKDLEVKFGDSNSFEPDCRLLILGNTDTASTRSRSFQRLADGSYGLGPVQYKLRTIFNMSLAFPRNEDLAMFKLIYGEQVVQAE